MNKILFTILIIICPWIIKANDFSDNYFNSTDKGIFSRQSFLYLQTAEEAEIRDFGDSPISYGSADHIIDSKNYLGSLIDDELAYQPSVEADADDKTGKDDEDGVIFPEMVQGTKVIIQVKVVGLGYLNVWIDWNGDGDFGDNNELVIKNSLKISGTINITVTVPADAVVSKPTFARFRFGPSTATKPVYSSTGSAKFGEVEDYMIKISCAPVAAPKVGPVIQPTCEVPTGSVILNGLPETGTWILIRYPGGEATTGTGPSTTVTGLEKGTYSFTVTNSAGCTSTASSDVVINPQPATPSAPIVGTITQPTCTVSTGSVVLNGLPPTGTWKVTRSPGGAIVSGTGTSTTVSGIEAGTYSFTVTNSAGCTSTASSNVVINPQPATPTAPLVGNIIQPTCTVPSGSVVLSGLPATGIWTLTRFPGTIKSTGTGTSTTISGFTPGIYNYNVTNADGCTSALSADIVIYTFPSTPTPPVPGTITQPTCTVSTGKVVLNGLPSTGTWKLVRYPDGVSVSGTGTSTTVSGLVAGTYNFRVINSAGCTSILSSDVVINPQPATPTVNITDPAPVCSPATVNLKTADITKGSTEGLIYTYWRDPEATLPYSTPEKATAGTYYIKGTTPKGCYDIQPVIVTVYQTPEPAHAGPDQILEYVFNTTLNADDLEIGQSGTWSIIYGSVQLSDVNDPKASVSELAIGKNILVWTVTNGLCPESTDYMAIIVHDLVIPTLITPDIDGKNDYFILRGLETLGKTEITVFDRRGVRVYTNKNYNNEWDGIDYNGKPLPDDTYFFLLKSETGKSLSGFIVIRRKN